MNNKKLFIPILLGTVRKGRESEKVAKFLFEKMSLHKEIETQLFDPREINLPMEDEGQELKFKNPEYRNAIIRADGLVVISPEYNHGYPGSLKRVLDIISTEYAHRAVGLVGVSAGPFGGVRAVDQLAVVVRTLGLSMTSTDLHFSKVGEIFDGQDKLKDNSVNNRTDGFLTELIWVAKVLRWGRENLPSKYDGKLKQLQKEWDQKTNHEA